MIPKMTKLYTRHYEESVLVNATPPELFAFVDEHANLSSHMSKTSWMMGGGKMTTEIDDGKSKQVGSHIKMSGKAFGITLFLDEVVSERIPPNRKVWETVGSPRLIVIGPYQLGFNITPGESGSNLNVFIDYELPASLFSKVLGQLFGGMYAKWCVRQMISSATRRFN